MMQHCLMCLFISIDIVATSCVATAIDQQQQQKKIMQTLHWISDPQWQTSSCFCTLHNIPKAAYYWFSQATKA